MSIILKAENISKQYRLGSVGTGTLTHDLNRWWHQIRGKEDPYLKIGGVNDRSAKAVEDYVWTLRDINFEVKQGEVLGVIGKNGAGKSTLLKILSRVTAPTTGSIKTKGRIASLLEVGTGFHGELTGRENIFMNGVVLGMNRTEIKNKLDEIIAFSGCEKYIDTPVKRYSSGMTVRLGFAVAAHLEPEILVVDEVLAVGDAEFQKKAIGKMQDLSTGEGRTVLFVSHNMDTIRALCHRGILLENGMLTENSITEVVVDKYLSVHHKQSGVKLKDREDRKGGNKLISDEIQFISLDTNMVIDEIITGMHVKIRLYFTVIDDLLYNRKIRIGLSISNKNHSFLTVLQNKMSGFNLRIRKDRSYFDCIIKSFPLTVGEFYIRIVIQDDETDEIYDYIDDAIKFNVLDGDFYRTGTKNANGRQGVYINQEWK